MNITDRQLEIIKASGKILTTEGLSSLTIKNLSEEIGFSESALYRHFKSKEDVIVLLIEYLIANMKTRLDPIIISDISAEEKIRVLFTSQFTFLRDNPHFVVAVLSDGLIDESQKVKAEIEKLLIYKFGIITKVIEEMIIQNNLQNKPNITALTYFMIGGFRFLMLRWKISKFSFDLLKEGTDLMENFILLVNQKN